MAPFALDMSVKIEAAFAASASSVSITLRGRAYLIDFSMMTMAPEVVAKQGAESWKVERSVNSGGGGGGSGGGGGGIISHSSSSAPAVKRHTSLLWTAIDFDGLVEAYSSDGSGLLDPSDFFHLVQDALSLATVRHVPYDDALAVATGTLAKRTCWGGRNLLSEALDAAALLEAAEAGGLDGLTVAATLEHDECEVSIQPIHLARLAISAPAEASTGRVVAAGVPSVRARQTARARQAPPSDDEEEDDEEEPVSYRSGPGARSGAAHREPSAGAGTVGGEDGGGEDVVMQAVAREVAVGMRMRRQVSAALRPGPTDAPADTASGTPPPGGLELSAGSQPAAPLQLPSAPPLEAPPPPPPAPSLGELFRRVCEGGHPDAALYAALDSKHPIAALTALVGAGEAAAAQSDDGAAAAARGDAPMGGGPMGGGEAENESSHGAGGLGVASAEDAGGGGGSAGSAGATPMAADDLPDEIECMICTETRPATLFYGGPRGEDEGSLAAAGSSECGGPPSLCVACAAPGRRTA